MCIRVTKTCQGLDKQGMFLHESMTQTHTCASGSWLSLRSHCPRDHISSRGDTPAYPCRDLALGGDELALGVTLGDVGSRDRHTRPPLLTQGLGRFCRGDQSRIERMNTCASGSWLSLGSQCPRDHFSSRGDTPALPCRLPALGGEELALGVTLGDVGSRELGHTGIPLTLSQRANWGGERERSRGESAR